MEKEACIQELERGARLIAALVDGCTQDQARLRPAPESWSVLDVVCHLHDEEREDFRQRLDIVLHRPAQPWSPIDPPGWVTARRYAEQDLAGQLDGFQSERQRSLAWLRGLRAPNWEAQVEAPWGPIKAGDLLAAWVAHDGLHVRQLVELKRFHVLRLVQPYDVRYAGDW
jgi:hypothetical protein